MRHPVLVLATALSAVLCATCTQTEITGKRTTSGISEAEFLNPPMEARPRVWWHWEDGNITKDGIRKDLEWMHRTGIGGYHHFDAGMAQNPVVENRMVYMHDDWKDAFRYAINLSDSLGMSVGIASSPGWSNTGGPWVKKDDAMKALVWSSIEACQGHIDTLLPQPETKLGWYRDVRTIAVKLPESDDAVRAIRVLGNNKRHKWNVRPYSYNLILEASDDGKEFREVARIPQTNAGSITVNVPATQAADFRLRDESGTDAPAYILYTRPRVERAEEKAGFSTPYDLNDFPTRLPEGTPVPATEDVADLSGKTGEDGRLVWNAPEGQWRIFRFGCTLTGKKNGPAPKEATGLEVDKLDQDAYRNYFHEYLDMYRDATDGMIGARGITELLVDSYEAGWQTWTPKMEEQFGRRRGYDLLPWMPALAGEIISSAEATEKFLFDWRRTIAELYAESYAGVKDIAAEYGIPTVCLESQENGRVFVADGMDIKRRADVPMAAIWTEVDHPTSHSTIPIAVADMRESASVSHLYGGRWVAAESMTADGLEGKAYSFTPERLKRLVDTEFASGVNRIFVHESSHQPLDGCRPGLGLGKYGQWFNRHETWAEQAVAWTDYMARSCYLLSRGANVADILVYYGEDTNVTAKYGVEMFPAPAGFNYDFINPRGLKDLKVKGRRVIAPSGASYALLCLDIDGLPQSEDAAEELERLEKAGAVICDVKELTEFAARLEKDFEGPSELRFVHHRRGHRDIWWVNNPSDLEVNGAVSLRCAGFKPMAWNPEDGSVKEVSYRIEGGRTVIPVQMNPDDAIFFVFSGEKAVKEFKAEEKACLSGAVLELKNWEMKFPGREFKVDCLRDYGSFDEEDVKYFSGTCVYTSTFTLDAKPSAAVIDLGRVCDLCELKVNGRNLGILWRAPFRRDVSDEIREGLNTIEVKVVNTWVNRLIGDAQPDCPAVTTYTTVKFYDADAPTAPAGLLGPVALEF